MAAATYLLLLLVALLALVSSPAMARDPGALQDFCVADKMSNGIYSFSYSITIIYILDTQIC